MMSAVVWENVACPLCEAREERLLLEVSDSRVDRPLRLVRCRRCGMGYLNSRPDPQSISRFYPEDYGPYHHGERIVADSGRLASLRRLVVRYRCGIPPAPQSWRARVLVALGAALLAPPRDSLTCLPYQGRGRLLEYGCGAGWLGQRLRDLGWDVTGMDFSAYAAAQAQRLFGLPVILGSLPHPAVQEESFDVIVMGAVLEHVHRPHDVISAAARALRPGGYLVVAVPNLASWGFRTFQQSWWGLQLPIHLLHFTPTTLRRLLEAHGLEVGRESQPARGGWMRRSLAAARKNRLAMPLWLRTLARPRLATSLLTRWTVAAGQGDCLLTIGYRPRQATSSRAA
jgi:SAM-dependent methyltransferase